MKPTGRARVLVAAAGGFLLAGVLSVSVTPSAIGLALLVFLLHARFTAARAFEDVRVRVERHVLEDVVHEDGAFHVRVDARGTRVPEGVRFTLRDAWPAAVTAATPPVLAGPVEGTFAARATAKGSLTFPGVDVTLADARGLWHAERHVVARSDVTVLPSRDALHAGRRLARRNPLEVTTRHSLGHLVRDLEFETVREYVPGDRLRDVDWKRVAQYQRLITKSWEREHETTIVLLVDAGRTMRARLGDARVTKLDHAAALALELAEAAVERNHRVGYASFDEARAVDEARPTRDRAFPQRLARRLADLPRRLLVARRLDVGLPGESRVDEQELDFLHAVSRAHGARRGRRASARSGFSDALSRVLADASGERLFVIAFTDLESVPDHVVRALTDVARRGHRVLTVVLPGSRFLDPPADPRVRDLENAYRESVTRKSARAALERQGVSVLELGPEESALRVAVESRNPARTKGGAS